jgi:hypothetical protein
MIRWVSDDLLYLEHSFGRSARKKFYAEIQFKDIQTKRRIAVYDWSGLESAALTFEHFQGLDANARWRISGLVNTSGKQHFLVLYQFALLLGGKLINPYTMSEGVAEVELVGA